MLAHGESQLGPALLFFFIFYPLSIWTLVRGLSAKRSRFTTICGIVIAAISGVGAILLLVEFVPDAFQEGRVSLDELRDFLLGLAFWLFPLLCGIIALRKTPRAKGQQAEHRTRNFQTTRVGVAA